MRLFVPRYKDIPSTRNLAYYKRIEYLSTQTEVFLLTRHGAHIDELLSARLKVVFCPTEIRLPAWIPGLIRRNIGLWWDYFRYSNWAIKYVLQNGKSNTDTVYTFQNFEANIGWQLKSKGFTWVADVLDMPDLYLEYPKRFRRSGKIIRAIILEMLFYKIFRMKEIFRDADQVFAIGPTLADGCAAAMVEEYQVPLSKVFPTVNGVDLTLIAPKPLSQVSRSESESLRLCYVGRLSPDRGVSTMLAAVAALRDRQVLVRLDLVGDISRDYRSDLPEEIERLGLKDVVILHGFLEHQEALAIVNAADICLYPFPNSSVLAPVIPIKVLEYLALSKVVIASDLPGVRHVVHEEENGLLVPPEDAEALAGAIERVSRDQNLRRTLEQNARGSINQYEWDHINKLIFQRLRDFCGSQSTDQRRQLVGD